MGPSGENGRERPGTRSERSTQRGKPSEAMLRDGDGLEQNERREGGAGMARDPISQNTSGYTTARRQSKKTCLRAKTIQNRVKTIENRVKTIQNRAKTTQKHTCRPGAER